MNTSVFDNESPQPAPGPLNGIRVLDISTVYAAPITAMLLGDYGADVLEIEHPDGEFVGLPVADRAQRLLDLAGRHPARAGELGQHVSG